MSSLLTQGIEFSIGKWNIALVPQAKIAMYAYAVMVAAYILVLFNMMSLIKSKAARAAFALLFALYMVVIACVGIYNLNCTVVGNCKTFAWILSGFISVTAIYMVWLAGMSFFMPKK